MDKKHNGVIAFWKFAYAMLILLFHADVMCRSNCTKIFAAGSIGVEFFFLVSGWLLASSALNSKSDDSIGKDTLKFIWKKIKSFFPYVLIFHIIGLIGLMLYTNGFNISKFVLSINELILMEMAGFKTQNVNGPVWYISAMIISMFILYPLVKKYKKDFIRVASIIIVVLLGGWLIHKYGSLRMQPRNWTEFGYRGTIRAFVELNLGMVMYLFTQKLSKVNFSKFGLIVLTLFEMIGFIIPFYVSHKVQNPDIYNFTVLLILAFSIGIAFSGKTLENKLLSNKFVYFLEKMSLPIFLSQVVIRRYVDNSKWLTTVGFNTKVMILILATFILSYLSMKIVEFFQKKKLISNLFNKLFIIQEKTSE